MIQRSSTFIARINSLLELADFLSASIPYCLMGDFQQPTYQRMRKPDAALHDRLRAAGHEDESGLFIKYVRRDSGYYIDVGVSDLIANGRVKGRYTA